MTPAEIIGICTAIGTVMMTFGRYVMPAILTFLGLRDKEMKKSDALEDRILLLETNHIAHLKEDITDIKAEQYRQREIMVIMGNKITRLETINDVGK